MKVMCWVKTGYRQQSRAYFYASCILKEYKNTVRFLLLDGTKTSVKKNDLISIEEGGEND